MIYLTIDTTDNKKISVSLTSGDQKFIKEKVVEARSAQLVLLLIDELLNEHHISPKDLEKIYVNTGPGSFTGLRVGLSVANAFAFALQIPVNDSTIHEGKTLIEPTYA